MSEFVTPAGRVDGGRLFKNAEPASGEWYVDQPFDLDLFDSVPSTGPYRTAAEAEAAENWLRDIVSGADD